MKLAVALAVLFLATAAQADSTVVVDVTASQCNGCHPDVNLLPTALNAQFTLEQVTGTFFNSGGSFSFYGTEWEVIGINGTLNGYPMALSTGPQGQASWLLDSAYPLEDYALGTVYFTVDGSFAWLENDNEFNLLEVLNPSSAVYGNPITWNVVEAPAITPEPSALLLSGIGLAALLCLFAKLKIRAVSN
jgi:hypothetical protein